MGFTINRVDIIKDKQAIINFWKDNFSGRPASRYTWIYEKGFYGQGACWIAVDQQNNNILGTIAQFPRKFYVNGIPLTGGITGDFGVNKKHRLLMVALSLQKAMLSSCKNNGISFLCGVPNKKAISVQKRTGFTLLGEMDGLTKILKSEVYLSRYIKIPILLSTISFLANLILKAFSKELYFFHKKLFNITIDNKFDNRFDAFWKNIKDQNSIIGERTSSFLDWRFRKCPLKKHQVFILSDRDDKNILGYIIFNLEKNSAQIDDIQFINKAYFDTLLSEFIKFSNKNGYYSISFYFFGNDFILNKMLKFRFIRRETATSFIVYVDSGDSNAKILLDKNKWYFTNADNDI